jgi:hypothetical protein
MELSEMIMRIVYLAFLYVLLMAGLQYSTPLRGASLMTISFFGAVLVLYASFGTVYDFLLNNELIFQLRLSNSDDEDNDDDNNANNTKSSKTNITNELNVNNVKNTSESNVLNHSHKYIEDKVFK